MKFINKHKSPNYNNRKSSLEIIYIIIHYTAMRNNQQAIEYLCDNKNKVSSHFLINKSGKIYNLVNLKFRAWHAGKSYWKKQKDINSSSIGIEMDNSGHHLDFENYTLEQINSLVELLKFLIKKYKIKQENILGHSDIAPYRKIDPGEKFPWNKLFSKNIIYLPKALNRIESNKIDIFLKKKVIKTKKDKILYMLKKIGYDIDLAKKNSRSFNSLIIAYKMHYCNKFFLGKVDIHTYEIIKGHFNQVLTK